MILGCKNRSPSGIKITDDDLFCSILLTFCLAYEQRYLAASGVRHAVADLDLAGAAVGRGVSDLASAHRAQHRRMPVQDADGAGAGRDIDVGYLRIQP